MEGEQKLELKELVDTSIKEEIEEPFVVNPEDKNETTVEDKLPIDSYLNRNEYSSERFKIELKNLPKNFGFSVRILLSYSK